MVEQAPKKTEKKGEAETITGDIETDR